MTCPALPLKKCLKRERASYLDHLSGARRQYGLGQKCDSDGRPQSWLNPQGPIGTKSYNTNKQGGVGGHFVM